MATSRPDLCNESRLARGPWLTGGTGDEGAEGGSGARGSPLTPPPGAGLGRLLERGAEGVDRGSWDAAARLAERILALDPGNADAAAMLRVDGLRSTRLRDRAPWARRVVTVMFCDMVGSTALATV